MSAVAVPGVAVAKVRAFCEAQNRAELADKLRNDIDVSDRSITIVECRPPWDGSSWDWTRTPIVQIRYDGKSAKFTVHWMDSSERWRRYDEIGATSDIEALLREIDEDPTCVFCG